MAMGWLAGDTANGVIEHPEPPVDVGVLDMLEHRFPGRRWFAGEWDRADDHARAAA